MSAGLAIFTLGGLDIWHGGEPVTYLGSRKAEALLVYLAYSRRPVARDVLAALLWGAFAQTNALASLSVALSQLRKYLAPYIIATRHTVTFNFDSDYWLDIAELERQLHTWQRQWGQETTVAPEAVAQLKQALALYRGDFLAGFYVRDGRDFEEWALVERERLRRKVVEAGAHLVRVYRDHGQYRAGIDHARRWLALDPLREETHRLLMLMLARSGRRNAALAQYERYREILGAELGVEPTQETIDLYQRIRLAARGPRHNLPVQTTSFIGREDELAQLTGLLIDRSHRLVTVMGPAGIGKTRLAQAAGHALQHEYLNGVWFVDLAPLEESLQVFQELASTLGIQEQNAGKGRSLLEKIIEVLKSRELLLILDNCEHQIGICVEICNRVGNMCPYVSLLVTSRERLGIVGEAIWQTPPMALPPVTSGVGGAEKATLITDAVRLFAARARLVYQGFKLNQVTTPKVALVCRQLEGLPLAIELAASRLRVFSLSQIQNRLDNRFRLLTDNHRVGLPRHWTLLASVEWSYELLSENEQCLFQRLSVFRSGFSLEAAEVVCSGNGLAAARIEDTLTSLVDKSLVMVSQRAGKYTRFGMLETLREFGKEKVTQQESNEETSRRHAYYFLTLAEEAYPQLFGPQQRSWRERLRREYDNIRAVLRWSLWNQEVEVCLHLGVALWEGFWLRHGYYQEGQQYLKRILALSHGTISSLRARVSLGIAVLAWAQGDIDRADRWLQNSLALGKETGDTAVIAWTFSYQGKIKRYWGERRQAVELFQRSLASFRQIGDHRGIAWQLYDLGFLAHNQGKHQSAKSFIQESLALHRQMGNRWAMCWPLSMFGNFAIVERNYERAHQIFQEVLSIYQEQKNKRGQIYIHCCLGCVAVLKGINEEAKLHFLEADQLAKQMGDQAWIVDCMFFLGRLARFQGKYQQARSLLDRHLPLALETNQRYDIIRDLYEYASLARAQGHLQRAATLLGAASRLSECHACPLIPFDQHFYECEDIEIQATLGKEAFVQAWEKGAAMALATAVAYAREKGGEEVNLHD